MGLLQELQRGAVDSIKRHAIALSVQSPRAQAYILTEYLWAEEGTEQTTLHRTAEGDAPVWLRKLIAAQLEDEHRHAELLRGRLGELGIALKAPPALARAKLWWLERAVAPYLGAFAAGPVLVLLAVAAQLEATGARVLARHLEVLERRDDGSDRTAAVVRAILADERRHARSCAAAAERLVRDDERGDFEALRERVGKIDRAFGVTLAVRYWVLVAALAAADRVTKETV
jgi:hypothetical protein